MFGVQVESFIKSFNLLFNRMTTIRKMQESDLKTIHDIGVKVEGLAVSETIRFWTKQKLYGWVTNNKDDELLVAEDKGKVIGFIMSIFHNPTRIAIIDNLYVAEEYRRRGIGKDLVKECLKRLKERGLRYIYVTVKKDNKAAIEFFKSLEFNKGYDFVWMERS